MRQAVACAIDRAEIRDVAYFGAGELGLAEVPTGSRGIDGRDVVRRRPDVDKAKQAAGRGRHHRHADDQYLGLPQYPELLKTGEVVREQLKEIGIDMAIEPVDVSVWFDRFAKGDYQITRAYQERTIDPDNFYSLVCAPEAGRSTRWATRTPTSTP